jgi:hypothetical protein
MLEPDVAKFVILSVWLGPGFETRLAWAKSALADTALSPDARLERIRRHILDQDVPPNEAAEEPWASTS